MNTHYIFTPLLITCLITPPLFSSPLQKVYAFFGANVYQQAINAEYELENPGILTLENVQGNITIAAESNQKKVLVSAVKKAHAEKTLPHIRIKGSLTQTNNTNHLTLRTEFDKDAYGEIDYSLVIPKGVTLQLTTDQGNITIGHAHGPISATTNSGSITITKAGSTVKAQTEQGSITISEAAGNVTANTINGNITIEGSKKSVVAQTEKGEIIMHCAQLPATGRIQLSTHAGNVKLTLPENVNAAIFGQTEKGTLVSDAFIDIKPRTTKLDKKAWKQFQKEVEGTLGSGEAEIKVTTAHGNIKIAQTQSA
jgi:DUF4097 and DUF4098 domain-containing protein YvlB